MSISFVIVNYNTSKLTELCLQSLKNNKTLKDGYEVIVVDNGSTPSELKYLKRLADQKVTIFENLENSGFGVANNIGSEIASHEILCFINSDVTARDTNFVELENLVNVDTHGLLSCTILNGDGSFQSAGFEIPTMSSEFRQNILFENFNFRKGKRTYKTEGIGEVGWISGAFMLIRKQVFYDVKGFDPNIFMYAEDLELSLKVRSAGYKNIVNFGTKVVHDQIKKRYSKDLLKKISTNKKNYYYVLEKYSLFGKTGLILVKVMSFLNLLLINSFKYLRSKTKGLEL